MSVYHYGGGVGGWTPGEHTEPADTLAHWKFQGNRQDLVGSYALDAGEFGYGGIADNKTCLAPGSFNYDNSASTSLNPNNNTDNKYTFATALYVPNIISVNADIVRYESIAGGNVAFRVGLIGTAGAGGSPGALYIGADTGAGYQQHVTTATVSYNKWIHFAFTMNAAGTGGAFYEDGSLLETWSIANAPNSTAAGARFGIGAAWNNVLFASYFSTIVREKECSAAEILTMAGECGF